MNVEQIGKWLSLLGEHKVEENDPWVNTHCPLAPWRHKGGSDKNPSFGVKVGPGDSQVWCFSCHFGGTQTGLLLELSRLLRGEVHTLNLRTAMSMIVAVESGDEDRPLWTDEDDQPKSDLLFPQEWLDRFQLAHDDGEVHSYLERRGMPYEVAVALDLRYMHSEDRVCFPIRNWAGDLVGLHGRAILDEVRPRYRMITHKGRKNPLAWLGENWIEIDKPVVFTESVFDLARVYQVYRNVACPLTSSMSVRKIQRVARCDQVITMFDPDEAGRSARRKVGHVLGDECAVSHVLLEDRDPGDMTPHEVASVLQEVVALDRMLL